MINIKTKIFIKEKLIVFQPNVRIEELRNFETVKISPNTINNLKLTGDILDVLTAF